MRRCIAFFLLVPGALLAQGGAGSVGRREQILFITAPVTLDTTVPTSFACRTSQSAVLHLDIVDERQGVVFKSQDWGAEPDIPVSKRLDFGGKPHLDRNFIANLSIRYRGVTGPSVSFGLGQGIDSGVLAPSVGRTGFVPNPARPPAAASSYFCPRPPACWRASGPAGTRRERRFSLPNSPICRKARTRSNGICETRAEDSCPPGATWAGWIARPCGRAFTPCSTSCRSRWTPRAGAEHRGRFAGPFQPAAPIFSDFTLATSLSAARRKG